MKKIYLTVEADEPNATLDKLLNVMQNVKGVTFAMGQVGMTGTKKKRRYSLETLFSGKQPSDYGFKERRTA